MTRRTPLLLLRRPWTCSDERSPPRGAHTVAERLAAVEGPHAFDQLLNSITSSKGVDRHRLAELARWLCRHGVKRQQVKAGLALLGVSGAADGEGLVSVLGPLEEITLYSLVALGNLLQGQAEPAIFALAQNVDGSTL